MRHIGLFFAVGASLCASGFAFLAACGSDPQAQPIAPDAAEAAVAADTASPPTSNVPGEDASRRSCKLDDGSDPLALCIQKAVLRGQHESALTTNGVVASWDSTSFRPDTDDAGVPLHDVHDDVAYAASIARYHDSSGRYGDTEYTLTLDVDLVKLAPVLKDGLKTLPQEYGGDLYWQLRTATGGLRFIDHKDEADALDLVAEAYARAIYTQHFFSSGMDGDGGPLDGVLATDSVTLEYAPADVVTGALALLDMASRHAVDDPANAARWQDAARVAIEHVVAHGREPVTKMYLRSLRATLPGTGATLDDTSHAPLPADLLSTDVAATIALALVRAQDLVVKNPSGLAKVSTYPFEAHAEEAIASLNGTPSLWDATAFGYVDGYVPSATTLITSKSTRANALLFAAIHRASRVGAATYAKQLKPLRTLLAERLPPNTTFFSVASDQPGYFRTVSSTFGFLAADGGPPPRAKSYFSSATAAVIEGFSEQAFGLP